MTSSSFSSLTRMIPCIVCSHPLEPLAKFCGECGSIVESTIYQSIPLESAFAQAASRMGMYPSPSPSPSMTGNFPAQNGVPTTPPSASSGIPQEPAQQTLNNHVNPEYVAQSFSQPLPQQVVIPNQVSYDDLAKLEAYRLSQINGTQMDWAPTQTLGNGSGKTVPLPPTGGAPTFAHLNSGKTGVSPALVSEMESLNAALIREKLFLLMHWSIFLVCNLVGFYIALSCYYGVNGDEVTKLVMALTPLTFINAVALACLSPIRGTRREIMRLMEKRQYVQFQMEYSNIM